MLQGYRNLTDGLWDIPIVNPNPLKAEVIHPVIHPALYGQQPKKIQQAQNLKIIGTTRSVPILQIRLNMIIYSVVWMK